MKTIYFITGNKQKVVEMQKFVPSIEQLEIDLPEIQSLDPHETIRAKLTEALKHHAGPIMVEDVSLDLDGLNGFPGVLIKWFHEALGLPKIHEVVSATGNTKATARCSIGYAEHADSVQFFDGEVRGDIVAPRGSNTFGFDPIFQPEGHDRTFAEMELDEKNKISHRKLAAEKLATYLEKS